MSEKMNVPKSFVAKVMAVLAFAGLARNSCPQEVVARQAVAIGAADIGSVAAGISLASDNPAQLASIEALDMMVSYALPYGLKELAERQLRLGLSTPFGSVGGSFSVCGDDVSRFTAFGLQYSRRFGVPVSVGFGYHIVTQHIPYDIKSTTGFSSVGFQYSPVPECVVAFALHNVEQSAFDYDHVEADCPSAAQFGVRWRLGCVSVLGEVEKRFDSDPVGKAALCVEPGGRLYASFGVSSAPLNISAGAGFAYGLLTVNAGVSYHRQLGVTSGVSFVVCGIFNQKPAE